MVKISKFRIIILAATIASAVSLQAWAEEKPTVVVDIPVMGALVQSFAGDQAEIEVLLEPNHDAHHFSLSPRQVEALSEADVVFGVGSIFLPEMVKASQNTRDDNDLTYFYSDEHPDLPEDQNPHLWLSQSELFKMRAAFETAWVNAGFALSPSAKPWTKDASGHINFGEDYPKFENQSVALIASHAAFENFENDNKIKSFGAFHDANDQPLPPRQFNAAMNHIQNGDIRCLLMETSEHDQDLEAIAEDHNLDIVEFDILGSDIPPQEYYFLSYFSQLNLIYEMCHSN